MSKIAINANSHLTMSFNARKGILFGEKTLNTTVDGMKI